MLRHKYPYIGLHTRCIMGYAQILYSYGTYLYSAA